MWYAAHILVYYKGKDGSDFVHQAEESVVLIESTDARAARTLACKIGKECELDDTMTMGGRPVIAIFLGVRQIVECQNRDGSQGTPDHGCELTYTVLEGQNEQAFRDLVQGKPVSVTMTDYTQSD